MTSRSTVDSKDYESVWSNEAHYRADEAPYIGSNGNWWVGGTDTGVKAAGDDGKPGKDGETPYIGENGNWWIGFTDTKVKAGGTDGKDGEKGEDGETPYIGRKRQRWIGETEHSVKAVGTDGADGTNGTDGRPQHWRNGNWWIGTTDTGVKAAGTDGTNGTNGADGLTPSIGETATGGLALPIPASRLPQRMVQTARTAQTEQTVSMVEHRSSKSVMITSGMFPMTMVRIGNLSM